METDVWRRANVLAVDDQPANLIALDAVLSAEFNVIRATSGPQAISILESRRDIDVVLMDVQMPIMDGFETAARIKAMEGCEGIPIVFITAVYKEDPFVKQGYKVGAIDYFGKPYDPEILRAKVAIYASFRQKSDMLKERARQIREAEELMRTSRRLSAILEDPRLGVIVTDGRGRMRQTNPVACDLFKDCASQDAILGWWKSDGEPSGGEPPAFVRALAEGCASHETRVDVRGADGMARSFFCHATPLRDLEGRNAGAVLVIHDVTERRRMERDLETRIQRLVPGGAELHAP